MQLTAGDRLGPYEIVAQIGAGGMGVVYRAHDPRVGRDVAIKVSGEHFSDRFEREARAVAALTHANVCTLHDVGPNYLVMELVEGEPPKGPLPLDTALQYARQIADALDAAHEKGIVHRDLKPDNIRIRPDGVVKVLDFGLAKMDGGPAGAVNMANSPTALGGTQVGMILGTAAYMAPEQARGKPVDKRADIWAFGVVLYEMITGRRAFEGDDVSSVLAAVIQSEPRWDGVPARLRRLLASCLEKDPRKRLRDIGDVWKLLDEEQKPAAASRSPSGRARWVAAAALAVTLGAVLALWGPWRSSAPASSLPGLTLDVDLGPDVSLVPLEAPTPSSLIISRDGRQLVFVGSLSGNVPRLYTRRLDDSRITELAGTTGARNPFFTRDGGWVAFWSRGKLAKVPVEGGAVVPLADLAITGGGTVADDGSIVAGTGPEGSGLVRIPPGGGVPAPLVPLASGERFHTFPHYLPGRNAVLIAAVGFPPSIDTTNIDIVFLDGGRRKTIIRGASSPRYLPSGHLLYANRRGVFAVAVDTQSWETRGTSVPILPDAAADPITHGAQYDVADNGTLVYRKTSSADSTTLVRWLDRAGRQEPLLSKPGAYLGPPRLSPDGRRLALTVQDGANSDIWVYDTQREGLTLLTAGGGTFENPTWTRKGHVVFESRGLGIHWTRADGGGQPRALTTPGLEWPTSVTTDGRVLAVSRVGAAPQIWSVELTEDASGLKAGEQRQLRTSASSEDNAAFSPDGRWMAYVSDESGKPEVYVSPFPAPEGAESRVQISSGGGLRPVWAPKASEVLYHIDGRIMAVPYSTSGGSFVAEKPRPWSSADVTGVIGFDVAPDGRVVIIVPAAAGKTSQSEHMIGFMQNVFDELRRRVPVAR